MSNNNSVNLRNVRDITANSITLLTDDNLVENIYEIFDASATNNPGNVKNRALQWKGIILF